MLGKTFDLDTCLLVSRALGDQIAGMQMMLSEFAKEPLGLLERRSPDFEQACEWVKDSRSP